MPWQQRIEGRFPSPNISPGVPYRRHMYTARRLRSGCCYTLAAGLRGFWPFCAAISPHPRLANRMIYWVRRRSAHRIAPECRRFADVSLTTRHAAGANVCCMTIVQTIGVIGAGTMATGIAHARVTTGLSLVMIDMDEERIARGVHSVASSLDQLVKKAKLSAANGDAALGRLRSTTDYGASSAPGRRGGEGRAIVASNFVDLDHQARTSASACNRHASNFREVRAWSAGGGGTQDSEAGPCRRL